MPWSTRKAIREAADHGNPHSAEPQKKPHDTIQTLCFRTGRPPSRRAEARRPAPSGELVNGNEDAGDQRQDHDEQRQRGAGAVDIARDRRRRDPEAAHRRGPDNDVEEDVRKGGAGDLDPIGKAGDREQDHRHRADHGHGPEHRGHDERPGGHWRPAQALQLPGLPLGDPAIASWLNPESMIAYASIPPVK